MKLILINKLRKQFHIFTIAFFQLASFIVVIAFYIIRQAVSYLKFLPFVSKEKINQLQSKIWQLYQKLSPYIDKNTDSISRMELVELSLSNLKVKKARSMITIGGMAIGIGVIVFLMSIGFGLQKLVINKVARLEEMRQINVFPQRGGKLKINDATMSDIKNLGNVKDVLPMIAVVARVNYNDSASDMPVYAVTTDYLKNSAIKPSKGKIFESADLVTTGHIKVKEVIVDGKKLDVQVGDVAGISIEEDQGSIAKIGHKIQDVEFNINPDNWVRVRENSTTESSILGYTKRVENISSGEEVWGSAYISSTEVGKTGNNEDGEILGKWIKAKVYLWKDTECEKEENSECEDGEYLPIRNEDGLQAQQEGFFAEINMTVVGADVWENSSGEVLGDSDDWVDIASESAAIEAKATKKVELSDLETREAVVNKAMLKVLGIEESEALDQEFQVTFRAVGSLLENTNEKIESIPSIYKIIGVTSEEESAIFYVPFINLRSMGISNYSQLKVIVDNQEDVAKIRKQIEAMGYTTSSVIDTVDQINTLFSTVRFFLSLVGLVALSIAALGMFNTLTVSLLERNREVGLMKALGMKSQEVKELFITESLVMGLCGGVLGIILGTVAGKLVSILLSIFSITKRVGYLNVTALPFTFILTILFLSLVIGVVTGFYPAKRATKISALDALRYE